jgi:hypothetical protein
VTKKEKKEGSRKEGEGRGEESEPINIYEKFMPQAFKQMTK